MLQYFYCLLPEGVRRWYETLPDNVQRVLRTVLQVVIGVLGGLLAGLVTYLLEAIPEGSMFYTFGGSMFSGALTVIVAAVMNRSRREVERGTQELVELIGGTDD